MEGKDSVKQKLFLTHMLLPHLLTHFLFLQNDQSIF